MPDRAGREASAGVAVLVGYLLFSAVQAAGAYALLAGVWGWPWPVALLTVVVGVLSGLGVVLSVGCFLGALWAWGWPWYAALAVSAPTLVLAAALLGVLLGLGGVSALCRAARRRAG